MVWTIGTSVLDRLLAFTNYRHPALPIISRFMFDKTYRNIWKSYTCCTNSRPSCTLTSCSPTTFELILVGCITYIAVPHFTVSHFFAIFRVNCHATQEEKAKIKVGRSSCMSTEDWIKWTETMGRWEHDCSYGVHKGRGGAEHQTSSRTAWCPENHTPRPWCMCLTLAPAISTTSWRV